MVAHNPEAGITRIKLPSGSKKVARSAVCNTPLAERHALLQSLP